MELFRIERYGECTITQDNESANLNLLKRKIEARKQRNLSDDGGESNGDTAEQVVVKTKKKSKHYVKAADSEILDQSNKEIPPEKRKKKKKKKQKESSEAEAELEVINNSTQDADEHSVSETTMTSEGDRTEVDESVLDEQELAEDTSKTDEPQFQVLGRHKRKKMAAVKRTLPRWLNEPVLISADIKSGRLPVCDCDFLSENTKKNLSRNEIDHLFPVQASVIPHLLTYPPPLGMLPRDVCTQAPTGSGKTLAYVLPIVESLATTIVRQVYCLVVLPSKDLAMQVKRVFDAYTLGTRLKVALLCGAKTFSKEQEKLVFKSNSDTGQRGGSHVDIVVATPGRLVDHMKQTTGFSLTQLRYLVVDEADRLMSEAYSDWLSEVIRLAYPEELQDSLFLRQSSPLLTVANLTASHAPLQKLLFSATLTQNPEKLSAMKLYHPILFTATADTTSVTADTTNVTADTTSSVNADTTTVVDNNITPIDVKEKEDCRFVVPKTLEESIVIVESNEKPLILFHLMLRQACHRVLCFTKSVEATHRLYVLVSSFPEIKCAEFSSNLSEVQRRGIIRDFRCGSVDLLIASDAMARGMDIDNVSLVVNYDAPANAKTYVHRVGRTARAGNAGRAITLLASREAFHFKQLYAKLHSGRKPKKMKYNLDDLYCEVQVEEASAGDDRVAEANRSDTDANRSDNEANRSDNEENNDTSDTEHATTEKCETKTFIERYEAALASLEETVIDEKKQARVGNMRGKQKNITSKNMSRQNDMSSLSNGVDGCTD